LVVTEKGWVGKGGGVLEKKKKNNHPQFYSHNQNHHKPPPNTRCPQQVFLVGGGGKTQGGGAPHTPNAGRWVKKEKQVEQKGKNLDQNPTQSGEPPLGNTHHTPESSKKCWGERWGGTTKKM